MTRVPLLFTTSALFGMAAVATGLVVPTAFGAVVASWLLFALMAAGFVWLIIFWTEGRKDARDSAIWLSVLAGALFLLPRWPHDSLTGLFGMLDGDLETVLRNWLALAVAGSITAWVLVRGPELRLPGE